MSRAPKPMAFRGSALEDLRAFPEVARRRAGFQLDRVQRGLDPDDWKPMPAIGQGVREIRVRDANGAFRVIYVARFREAVVRAALFPEDIAAHGAGRRHTCDAALPGAGQGDEAMTKESFESVWDAVSDTPAEAENMKLRSSLMIALTEHIRREKLTQARAAKLFGVTQPRISDLMRGKVDLFSIDTLVNMLSAAGLHVEIQVAKAA